MNVEAYAKAGLVADAVILKEGDTFYLEDEGVRICLTDLLNILVGSSVRITVVKREVLLDLEKAIVQSGLNNS